MSGRAHVSSCPHSRMLRVGVPGLADGVIGLAAAVLYGGTSVVRRLVDDAVWRRPGPGCRCGGVVHHVRCRCLPGRSGSCGC